MEGSRFYVRSTTYEPFDVGCVTSGRFGASDPSALNYAVYKRIRLNTSGASGDRLIVLPPHIRH